MHDIIVALGSIPPLTLTLFVLLIVAVLIIMPRVLVRLGVQKIGGIELNVTHDYETQYHTLREVDDIDARMKEDLWDWSEDLFLEAAEASPLTCDMAIGHVLGGIFSHIRNIIVINHLVDRLAVENEEEFYRRLKRGIRAVIKNTNTEAAAVNCPHIQDLEHLHDVNRYDSLIAAWLKGARESVIDSCKEKIEVYEAALRKTKTKYWKDVYNTCIEKNNEYIKGMRS